ncbi:MAG: hypothetical protein AAF632_07095 [Bacteroidota bacterium]
MVLRMQTYWALLQEMHRLPVSQFVVYLGEKEPTMATSIADFIDGDDNNFWFKLINIHHYDYEKLLSSDIPEEILLAILGDFKNESPEKVVSNILSRLTETSSDKAKLQRYVRQLVVIAKLRNLQNSTLQTIEKMPIEFDLESDVIYQRGKQEGKNEEKKELVVGMLRDGALSIEKIAAYARVSLDFVKQLQQEITSR